MLERKIQFDELAQTVDHFPQHRDQVALDITHAIDLQLQRIDFVLLRLNEHFLLRDVEPLAFDLLQQSAVFEFRIGAVIVELIDLTLGAGSVLRGLRTRIQRLLDLRIRNTSRSNGKHRCRD
jgi:hypothetical protein